MESRFFIHTHSHTHTHTHTQTHTHTHTQEDLLKMCEVVEDHGKLVHDGCKHHCSENLETADIHPFGGIGAAYVAVAHGSEGGH